MTRSIPEWIARNDDQAIPDRVKLRVHYYFGGNCAVCTRPAIPAEYDHIVPLILGGANKESNLQLLCSECHAIKTKLDVKLKAKVARVRKRHIGIKKPSRFPGSRDSRWKRKVDGTVVLRNGFFRAMHFANDPKNVVKTLDIEEKAGCSLFFESKNQPADWFSDAGNQSAGWSRDEAAE